MNLLPLTSHLSPLSSSLPCPMRKRVGDRVSTPCYYYDMQLLRETLQALRVASQQVHNAHIHYAVKACATAPILREIAQAGLGADCVSGGEIRAAIEAGFAPDTIVFAGVAKADWEIRYALQQGVECFNVESEQELHVINQLADELHTRARVCLRINPDVDAHTNAQITTGRKENKFGIQLADMQHALQTCLDLPHLDFCGLHFHIGSQITDMHVFDNLVTRIEQITSLPCPMRERAGDRVFSLPFREGSGVGSFILNVGGGLGIQYENPDQYPIPDFQSYFATFARLNRLTEGLPTEIHFELGRSIVAQCGTLLTHVLYVKQGASKQFAIVDAGMNDLVRPALYGAFHRIDNLTNAGADEQTYDVVGPVCESSDVFVQNYLMPQVRRGDLLAIRSAGAYGEVMASQYNLRPLPKHYTSDEITNHK